MPNLIKSFPHNVISGNNNYCRVSRMTQEVAYKKYKVEIGEPSVFRDDYF